MFKLQDCLVRESLLFNCKVHLKVSSNVLNTIRVLVFLGLNTGASGCLIYDEMEIDLATCPVNKAHLNLNQRIEIKHIQGEGGG